ncbi:MAG: lectin [Gammaproteobacteria bacterium]|nr:lectin [Gammaproteobacteria bacterium]
MNKKTAVIILAALFTVPPLTIMAQQDDEPPEMGFFVTSVGIGDGANLGGLAGADAHCNALATAAGSSRTWAAYLSTQGSSAVNARDRIGDGPWANANGLIMATSVENLHYDNSNLNWTTSLDENGNQFASRIETPEFSEHDILTGSQIDGTAYPTGQDQTCDNWTSNSEGSARVGHADRWSFLTPGSPWNSSHGTPGCSQEELVSVGGAGLLYCFATD